MTEPAAKQKFSFIEMLGEHPGKFASAGLVAVVSVWGFYLWQFSDGLSDSQETWGQFGDFVGGTLNSVFGFLGFLILLSSLRLQAKELAETRQELKASSEAQRMQAKHFEREAKKKDHADAIIYFMENQMMGNLNDLEIGITTVLLSNSTSSEIVKLLSPNTPSFDDIKKSGNIIMEYDLDIIKNTEKRIKFLDDHCFNLWSISPLSPILFGPVSAYDYSIKMLIDRGWITDLKFFGKHDFPIR